MLHFVYVRLHKFSISMSLKAKKELDIEFKIIVINRNKEKDNYFKRKSDYNIFKHKYERHAK